MQVNVLKTLTPRLQVCMGVELVHSVLKQVQDQVQLCCFGNASGGQRLGYTVSSTGGFGKRQNQDLRPGNVLRFPISCYHLERMDYNTECDVHFFKYHI